MNTEHPITPPPELVEQWSNDWLNAKTPLGLCEYIATQAARWGADQELEACCEWLQGNDPYEHDYPQMLRAARRPKPPSLKEQALKELKDWTDEKHGPGGETFVCEGLGVAIIRRALEALPDE